MAGEGINVNIGVTGAQQAVKQIGSIVNATQTAAAALVGSGLVQFLSQSIAAAETAARSQAQLAVQIRRSGEDAGAVTQLFNQQATALDQITNAGTSTVAEIQKLLLFFGATSGEVQRLTPLVLDLAATLGTSPVAAAKLLGSALDGAEINLGKLNITATSTDELIRKLTSAVGGTAAELKNASGGAGDLQREFGNAKENLGELLRIPVSKAFSDIAGSVASVSQALGGMKLGLGEIVQLATSKWMVGMAYVRRGLGLISADQMSTELRGIRQLQQELWNPPDRKTSPATGKPFSPLALNPGQVARSQLEVDKAELDRGKTQLEADYEARLIDLETYLQERRNQIELAYEMEVKAAQFSVEKIKDTAERQIALDTAVGLANKKLAIDRVKLEQDASKARVKAIDDVASVEAEQMQEFRKHQAERLQSEVELQQRLLQVRQDAIAAERARVQADFRLTSVERRQRELDSMREELRLIEEQTAALIRRRDALDPNDTAGRETINQRIDGLNSQGRGLSSQIGARGAEADPTSFTQQMEAGLVSLVDRIGTLAQQVRRSFESIGGSTIDSLADGMNGLLQQTYSWDQALNKVRQGISNGMTQAISRMFAEWIVGRTAVFLKELIFAKAEATAKAPGALLTSITSYGTAAIVGLAAITAAMAAMGGFAQGGYTGSGGKYQPAGIVHRGEYVFTKDEVEQLGLANIMAFRDSARRGYSMGGAVAFSPSISPTVNVAPAGLTVVVLKDPNELRRYAESHGGRMTVVNAASGNRLDLGVGT